MCVQNLKIIALPVPEIIGDTHKIWAVPGYVLAPFSPKSLMILLVNELVVGWRSGSVVGQTNEVTLRQARLVLGWVTVYGRVNHLGM